VRILIAGATGVLGRRLVRQFSQKSHHVIGLVRDERGSQVVRELSGEAIVGSIFDADSIARAVKEADIVIHAATAIPSKVPSKPADWAMNDRLRREGHEPWPKRRQSLVPKHIFSKASSGLHDHPVTTSLTNKLW
jgi:2-alkyl-3-oxoalkanoate reductase